MHLKTPGWWLYSRSTLISGVLLTFCCSIGECKPADLGPLKGAQTIQLDDNHLFVWGVQFSADGRLLAVGSGFQIDIWNWHAGQKVATLRLPDGMNPLFSTNPIVFSAETKWLATCSGTAKGDVVVRVWDAANWKVVKDIADYLPSDCKALDFSPNGAELVYANDRGGPARGDSLIAYSTSTWTKTWGAEPAAFAPVSVSYSPDGKRIAIGGTQFIPPSEAIADPVERIRQLKEIPQIHIIETEQHRTLRSITSEAVGRISWQGPRVATADNRYVIVFNTDTGALDFSKVTESTGRMDVVYSPTSSFVFQSDSNAVGNGHGLFVWDPEHDSLVAHMKGNLGPLAISRDGRLMAAGSDNVCYVWRIQK